LLLVAGDGKTRMTKLIDEFEVWGIWGCEFTL
jgi:hypothetical protein